MELTDTLTEREYVVLDGEAAEVARAGRIFLAEFGADRSALSSSRLCLDWTERRPHIAGELGAALTKRCFDLGWIERMKYSSAVAITALGRRGFSETFGIRVSEGSDSRTGEP